jgi:hyperosmotically inducible periplasmic protein
MNKIGKTRPYSCLMLSILLIATVSACSDSKTSSDAPNSTESNGQISSTENLKSTQNDAQSDTRRRQLNADIKAREQRNNIGGDSQKRSEADLSSEVRSKLEANIPRGKLTVMAKNADITVSGVVPTQDELDKIESLAMEIKGVNNVTVKVVVNP